MYIYVYIYGLMYNPKYQRSTTTVVPCNPGIWSWQMGRMGQTDPSKDDLNMF
jgi:hypothetical protein